MCPRGTTDDSLLRVHHIFLPRVNHISSQNIWHSCGGGITVAIAYEKIVLKYYLHNQYEICRSHNVQLLR
jgi:hypothetical protein